MIIKKNLLLLLILPLIISCNNNDFDIWNSSLSSEYSFNQGISFIDKCSDSNEPNSFNQTDCSLAKIDIEESNDVYFVDMKKTYYSYLPGIFDYLKDDEPNIAKHFFEVDNQDYPVCIKWDSDSEDVVFIKIVYSLKNNYEDKTEIVLTPNARFVYINNLYKNSTYYLKLIYCIDGIEKCIQTSFNTTDLGPRTMSIDGIYNVRDVGGYLTESGRSTRQGLLFRGGALSKCIDSYYDKWVSLTDEGATCLRDNLCIKSDFDLRAKGENFGLENSPIPDASIIYFAVPSYLGAFTLTEPYRKLFAELANEENYPIYLHCTGGADRTGTACFLLNALLGVKELDLIHDYEFTSFSIYSYRSSQENGPYPFYEFYNELKEKYNGNSLSEKVENYLLSIGLTQQQILNIKTIMIE